MERSVVVGRDSAQMIGLLLPFEETLVKNPRSCPPPIETEEAARLSDGPGDDLSLHTFTNLPPLLTTRGSESTGSTKYEGPHQQAPTGYAPSTLFVVLEYPPRLSSFMKNIVAAFPAATARCGYEPG